MTTHSSNLIDLRSRLVERNCPPLSMAICADLSRVRVLRASGLMREIELLSNPLCDSECTAHETSWVSVTSLKQCSPLDDLAILDAREWNFIRYLFRNSDREAAARLVKADN